MFLVMVNKNNLPQDVILVTTNRDKAQQQFLATVEQLLIGGRGQEYWDRYTPNDKESLLLMGYEMIGGNVAVVLVDTDGPTSDDAIRRELNSEPADDMTVEQVIANGEVELFVGQTVADILADCASNLDAANAWEIQGQVAFKGSDGKYYTITTESSIGECTNEFITDVLSEIEHE